MAKATKNQIALKKEGAILGVVKETEQERSAKIKQVAELHAVCEQAFAASLLTAVQIGELLISLKDEVPHGSWEAFMEEKFPKISVRTLQRYMALANLVRANTASLREFVASTNPGLNIDELSQRDLLRHLTWESAQNLMKLLSSEKSGRKELVAIVRSLSVPVLGCIHQNLGEEAYELHRDCSFDTTPLHVNGEPKSVSPKSLQVTGPTAIIIAETNPPSGDSLDSLKRNIRQDQVILIFAPLKHLSTRSYAELPHIIFHGVSLFEGVQKGSTDYFVALIGGGERALSAFKKTSQSLGTFCFPHATQQVVGDTALVVVES